MKFKWMKNQIRLTISDSNITSLEDLVFFPNLTELSIGNLTLNNLDGIEYCQKLSYFAIGIGSKIEDFSALSKLSRLTRVNSTSCINLDNLIEAVKNNPINEFGVYVLKNTSNMKKVGELNNLKILSISSENNISKMEGISNLKQLKSLSIINSKISKIEGIENLSELTLIDLRNNDIKKFTILSKNAKLNNIDLRSNPNLISDRNQYSSEQLDDINKIGLILDNNGTIYLDADKMQLFNNYTKLNLTNQNLTNLNCLKGMTGLTQLTLEHNNLLLEDEKDKRILKSMTKLETISLSYNFNLKDISVLNEMKSLKTVQIVSCNLNLNQIQDIINNITIFTTQETILTIVDCNNKENIENISLSLADIGTLPDFSVFKNLKKLSLGCLRAKENLNIEVISNCKKLENLTIGCSVHDKNIDFNGFNNLKNLNLNNVNLWTEDLKMIEPLKNNQNMIIDLRNNSITDASALLQFNTNTKIILQGNVNLTQESKNALKAKFGSNVSF